MSKKLTIQNNLGDITEFKTAQELKRHIKTQTARLAGLLYVLKNVDIEASDGYLIEAMEIASDMAYEVKQAVELMNDLEVGNA